jgi:hypothetical protein
MFIRPLAGIEDANAVVRPMNVVILTRPNKENSEVLLIEK